MVTAGAMIDSYGTGMIFIADRELLLRCSTRYLRACYWRTESH